MVVVMIERQWAPGDCHLVLGGGVIIHHNRQIPHSPPHWFSSLCLAGFQPTKNYGNGALLKLSSNAMTYMMVMTQDSRRRHGSSSNQNRPFR
jgi:hypothetical protein